MSTIETEIRLGKFVKRKGQTDEFQSYVDQFFYEKAWMFAEENLSKNQNAKLENEYIVEYTTLNGKKLRIYMSQDGKEQLKTICLKKIILNGVDIEYNDKMDFRIITSIETPVRLFETYQTSDVRLKERSSYSFEEFKIDITKLWVDVTFDEVKKKCNFINFLN